MCLVVVCLVCLGLVVSCILFVDNKLFVLLVLLGFPVLYVLRVRLCACWFVVCVMFVMVCVIDLDYVVGVVRVVRFAPLCCVSCV